MVEFNSGKAREIPREDELYIRNKQWIEDQRENLPPPQLIGAKPVRSPDQRKRLIGQSIACSSVSSK